MREYFLAGWASSKPSVFGWLRGYELGMAVASIVLALLLSLSGQSVWGLVVMVTAVVMAGAIRGLQARKLVRGDTRAAWPVRAAISWSGIGTHTSGVPTVLSQSTIIGFTPDDGHGGELAILEHPAGGVLGLRGRREQVVVIALDGPKLGVSTPAAEDARATSFGRLANGLAAAAMPVAGVDLVTRVTAWDPGTYLDWVDDRTPTGLLRDQAHELASIAAGVASSFHSWLVIRLDHSRLGGFRSLTGVGAKGVEAMCGAAWDVVDQVVRLAKTNGLTPKRVLTPVMVGALTRSWLDPSLDPNVTDGIDPDQPWTALPGWKTLPDGMAVQGSRDYWAHVAGWIPVTSWPSEPVTADVFSGFVDATDCPVRSITVSFRFTDRRTALATARLNSAVGQAEEVKKQNKGVVTDGTGDDQSDAATAALRSIIHGSAGVTPLIRVMASAPSMRGLRTAQMSMDSAMASMGFTDVTWGRGDQTRQVMAASPLGWPS
jgi:hypothetical protein